MSTGRAGKDPNGTPGQTFLLPWPPSANGMWRKLNGRTIVSERYRMWREAAGKALSAQGPNPVFGPVRVAIALSPPDTRRYDLDNRVKPILELLVASRIIGGSDHMTVREITVSAAEGFGSATSGGVRVTLFPLAAARREAA